MNIEQISGELVVESVVTLDETTWVAVAVASHRDAVHLAWTGAGHNVNTLWSPDGYNFGGKQTLPHLCQVSFQGDTVPAAPSLVAGNDALLLGWVHRGEGPSGYTTYPWVMWSTDPGRVIAIDRGDRAPPMRAFTMAMAGDETVALWLEGANTTRVKMARSQGQMFGPPVDVGKNRGLPLACMLNGELVLAWTEFRWLFLKPRLKIMSSRGGPFGQPTVHGDIRVASICALHNELVLSTRERGAAVIGFFRGGTLVPALRLPMPTRFLGPLAPSLCQHGNGLILAWTDGDRRINVARVRRP